LGLEKSLPHRGQQIGASSKDTNFGAVFAEQAESVRRCSRPQKFEVRERHCRF